MSNIHIDPALSELRASLARVMQAIDQALALSDRIADPPVRATQEASKKESHWHAVDVDWPQIGGRDFVPVQKALFETREYHSRYAPGEAWACCATHCPGAGMLAKSLGMPVLAIVTCAPDSLMEHVANCKRLAQGAFYMKDGVLSGNIGDWTNWQPAFLRPQAAPAHAGPVRLGARTINVILPASMTPEEFEKTFVAETRKAAVDLWVGTAEGAAHCAALGLDPNMFRRKTRANGVAEASPFRDLTVFRQRTDPDRVVEIMEKIVLRHLGLVA